MGSIDILALDEARHRHANEFAAALATLHVVRARTDATLPHLDDAIDRLDAQVALNRLLLEGDGAGDVGTRLARLCHFLLRSRAGENDLRIALRARGTASADCDTGTLLLIAYELLNNAIKHAERGREPIRVALTCGTSHARLSVANRFSEECGPPGTSSGLSIASALAERSGGRLRTSFGPVTARASVAIPIRANAPSRSGNLFDVSAPQLRYLTHDWRRRIPPASA